MDLSTLLKEVWTDFGAIITGAAGFLGGIFLERYRFGLEEKREKMKRRRKLIDVAREELHTKWGPITLGLNSSKHEFMQKSAFASLRPHLSKEFLEYLDHSHLVRDSDDEIRKKLAHEISRIEKEWGLI